MDAPTIYSKGIMLHAVKTSVSHLAWLTFLIAAPAMYFKDDLSLTEKCLVVGIVFTVIWSIYFSLCWLFHYRSLKEDTNLSSYLKLSDKEKGQEIGSWFEGW